MIYPPRVFEDPDGTGRVNNTKMVSTAWESLNTEFSTRFSPSVTGITLNFGTMLATCDQTLWCAHTEGLLDSLTHAILHSCTQLETFSVHIETPRNYTEVARDEEGFEDSTTEEQWKVIGQIMLLVTEVASDWLH